MRQRVRLGLGLLALAWASAAPAAAEPLGLESCGPVEGVRQCSGLTATWDGVPLDTTLTLPAGGGTRLPLVVEIHGFGNSKYEYLDPGSRAYTDNAYGWARAGYAVLTYTARGFWGSCGTPESRAASPAACARGYIHLADVRYEVRDTQYLVGRLVDEGVADPARIGVTGDSYGGGQTTMLAALRNRTMLPDGSLVPWRSPAGTPLTIAAAAPVIPWTDVVYAIAPNGRTLSYTITPPGVNADPVGVEKASFANGVYASATTSTGPGQPTGEPPVIGRPMGYLAPPGTDPEADVTKWLARAGAGEPYDDAVARETVDMLTRHHSAYWIDSSVAPPPLYIASGFTDDLFPVDEVLRFASRTRSLHPKVPLTVLLADLGHQRAANKPQDRGRLIAGIHAWFDRYLRGAPRTPFRGVTALTQTCPREALPGGPFRAASFAQLARAEVRFASGTPQTVQSTGGDPAVGAAVDPVAGGGDACATTSAATQSGSATYALPPAPARGYTLLGAPRISARLALDGPGRGVEQVAARLWDVAPGGESQTLVARGSYRPSGRGTETWELHANGWRFEPGHVPKLELLGNDAPYGRPSNLPFSVTVERLALTLPLRDRPDCRLMQPLTAPPLPAGQRYAPGVSTAVRASARGCAAARPRAPRRPGGRRGAGRRGPRFTG